VCKAGIVETAGSVKLESTEGGTDASTSWPRIKGLDILIISHSEFKCTHKLVLEANEFV